MWNRNHFDKTDAFKALPRFEKIRKLFVGAHEPYSPEISFDDYLKYLRS